MFSTIPPDADDEPAALAGTEARPGKEPAGGSSVYYDAAEAPQHAGQPTQDQPTPLVEGAVPPPAAADAGAAAEPGSPGQQQALGGGGEGSVGGDTPVLPQPTSDGEVPGGNTPIVEELQEPGSPQAASPAAAPAPSPPAVPSGLGAGRTSWLEALLPPMPVAAAPAPAAAGGLLEPTQPLGGLGFGVSSPSVEQAAAEAQPGGLDWRVWHMPPRICPTLKLALLRATLGGVHMGMQCSALGGWHQCAQGGTVCRCVLQALWEFKLQG